MGTWGIGLFSDDIACDVRDDYYDLVGDGFTGPEATNHLLDNWKSELSDPDASPVFWLALAATQWKYGRLEVRVKEQAIEIIETGKDLVRWQNDAKLIRKRQGILTKLKQKLESPQPPQKNIPRRFRNYTDWEVGDVISYQLKSGHLVLFRIIGYHTDKGGISPVCELLDWMGSIPPKQYELQGVNIRQGRENVTQFMLGRLKEDELPKERVKLIVKGTETKQEKYNYTGFLWSHLDRQLEKFFGLS